MGVLWVSAPFLSPLSLGELTSLSSERGALAPCMGKRDTVRVCVCACVCSVPVSSPLAGPA